jgi:hypothetical protein
MKVKALIKILEDCDPDAEVMLTSQPNYPFEYALAGVTVREEALDGEPREDNDWGDGCHGNDVLLAEGRQLRYGSREAWSRLRTE